MPEQALPKQAEPQQTEPKKAKLRNAPTTLSILWRITVVAVSTVLIGVNLVIAFWLWRASEKLQLQQELKRHSALVAPRYDAKVRDVRKLEAMTSWIRDRQDFPVSSGDEIVSRVFPANPDGARGKDTVWAIVYIPPGNHRLKYSFREMWGQKELLQLNDGRGYGPACKIGWEQNAVTLDLPTGAVHEIEFSVEEEGEETVLRVAVAGHHERTFPLRPGSVVRHSGYRYFNKFFPNQHLNEFDELNIRDVWHRREIVRNEVLYHGMSMKSRRGESSTKEGLIRLLCWIESDVPVSASADVVAAYSKEFIDKQRVTRKAEGGSIGAIGGPVPNVDNLFEPYDGAGNLFYRIPPQD